MAEKKGHGFYSGFNEHVFGNSAGEVEAKSEDEEKVGTEANIKPVTKEKKKQRPKSPKRQDDNTFQFRVETDPENRKSYSFHIGKGYIEVVKNVADYGRDPEGKRIKNVGQALELIIEKFLNGLDKEDRELFLKSEKPLSKFKF